MRTYIVLKRANDLTVTLRRITLGPNLSDNPGTGLISLLE